MVRLETQGLEVIEIVHRKLQEAGVRVKCAGPPITLKIVDVVFAISREPHWATTEVERFAFDHETAASVVTVHEDDRIGRVLINVAGNLRVLENLQRAKNEFGGKDVQIAEERKEPLEVRLVHLRGRVDAGLA
jgi:hypothetical protein